MPIRIWSHFEKQTDNRRKIHTRLLAHSEQIHSARRYLSTHFFCWFDKIYVKITVNLTEILNSWLEIEILRNGHFWEFEFILTVPQLQFIITKLLVMACNFNWFIKITQSFGSGFQSQNFAKPEVRLIMTDADLDRLSYQIRLGNTFGCELPTQLFIAYCCFFFYC